MDVGHHWNLSDELYAGPRQRGSYSPLHFVVRLRPEFFAILNSSSSEFRTVSDDSDLTLASTFSTFFHETIHWWQHIGSTTGFMLSMAYPAQAHVNRPHLLMLLQEVGPVKSLLRLHKANKPGMSRPAERALNTAVNNWHDLEFNRRVLLDPTPQALRQVVSSPYFVGIGHCLEIGLGNTLNLLAATVDPEFRFLPNIRRWEHGFERLWESRHEGYYPGSPVRLAPIGALHIFEGQARFNQLQYLHLASSGRMGWDEFRARGMLGGVYVAAFERFLEWAGTTWPASPLDPSVSLFLLICDLAINPSDGFPFDLGQFESFLESNNPGFRFFWFCRQIAERPELLKALVKLSYAEYMEASEVLCKSLVCKNPVEVCRHVVGWVGKSDTLAALLEEERAYDFREVNFPVRVCFAKFLRFAQDRARRPEFFCWPAVHFVDGGPAAVDLCESKELFDRHSPMFLADLSGEVRPALTGGRDEVAVQRTFNTFFGANIVLDLVRQWTIRDGPFGYDYSWLTDRYTPEQIKPLADGLFESAFGVEPDHFGAS